MDKLIIEGGKSLKGEVRTSGAKNAALPILFSAILTADECVYENVPSLADIDTTVKLLRSMGVVVTHDKDRHRVSVHAPSLTSIEAPYDLVRTMRASVLVLGPTLARFGEAKVSLPGGCSIGARPVNLHLAALEKMGAEIKVEGGYIWAQAKKLKGAEITFDQISVGATENTLMAAALAKGKTVLRNCAQEPEIVDLAHALRRMGALVHGDGTPVITVEGNDKLNGCTHPIIPDRIEAGTYLIASAITQGDVLVQGLPEWMLGAVLEKLRTTGAEITAQNNDLRIVQRKTPKSVDVNTLPFPGFPTDMQAQFMALMAVAEGSSVLTENIFENRFMHVAELLRLGADVTVQGKSAIVRGKPNGLTGASVMATDLRASACLVLAGLAAKGQTQVRRVYHLDRGYEKMETKLAALGAKIQRVKE